MSRIAAIEPAQASAPVQAQLEGVRRGLGMVPNMFRVAAASPAALEALTGLFGAVTKGRFDAQTREAIALTVSELNGCDYCLSAHSALGERAGLDARGLEQARAAESSDPHRAALLAFAKAVVLSKGRVGSALDHARAAGLSDSELLEVIANVGLTVFTNTLNLVAETDIDFPVVHHHVR